MPVFGVQTWTGFVLRSGVPMRAEFALDWGSDEGKVYFLSGSPGMGRVCSGMQSPSVGRTCLGIWGSDVGLGSVATGGEESDRSAPGFGALDSDRFGSEIWSPNIGGFGLALGVLVWIRLMRDLGFQI